MNETRILMRQREWGQTVRKHGRAFCKWKMAAEICVAILQKWRHRGTIAYTWSGKWDSTTATRRFSDGLGAV